MQCIVNGQKYTFTADITVSSLLKRLDIEEHRIVVEHNGELIKRHTFNTHMVKSDDKLELLEFVGGG